MTIKRKLILSHVVVFIVPIMMTVLVLIISGLGLLIFARNGNHIYVESAWEFQHASEAVHNIIFNKNDSVGYWLIGLLAPEQNFIRVTEEHRIIYSYGNESLQSIGKNLLEDPNLNLADKEFTYTNTLENDFVYFERQTFNGKNYSLYFVSERSILDKDKVLETALQNTICFVALSLIIFVLATSWLLSRFILNNILLPLKKLQVGAEKIQAGDLNVTLSHGSDDEIKPVMQTFNLMAEKLSESLQESKLQEESRKELVASISHDLRTPLTTIKAYVEGLIDNVADTPDKKLRYLLVIKKKADELNNLIEQLFLFSKMSLGEKAVPFETIDLKSMLEFFVSENLYVWQKSQAEVTLEIESNAKILGSFLLLERILSNIIGNSIKYRSEEKFSCKIRLNVEEKVAILSVSDNGIGVPQDSLKKLTEPFYRTDKARSHTENGTGLGLSIALKAVEMMNGTLKIENLKPHGLKVVIELPILKEPNK
ncbi:MAG: HAMP domain-containing histidine kinase [Selenomonadaceae bacterium]|nr:HAMP domain-containing histidine kinase [Selenomonadaceae bacterium]MBR7025875.1 HAMP domain-containing histidine kinase [Selenomonadaceae bacterium]